MFNGDVHLFCFRPETFCLGQFCPKYQNCQLKLKLDTQTNLNMLNSVMLFTCFVLDRRRPSWANLIQIVNIYNFFFFPIKNAIFWENLVQNVTIISLRLNLLASLIRIYRILRWCSLFSFSIGNGLFWANLVEKAKMISLSGNFVDTYCFG